MHIFMLLFFSLICSHALHCFAGVHDLSFSVHMDSIAMQVFTLFILFSVHAHCHTGVYVHIFGHAVVYAILFSFLFVVVYMYLVAMQVFMLFIFTLFTCIPLPCRCVFFPVHMYSIAMQAFMLFIFFCSHVFHCHAGVHAVHIYMIHMYSVAMQVLFFSGHMYSSGMQVFMLFIFSVFTDMPQPCRCLCCSCFSG